MPSVEVLTTVLCTVVGIFIIYLLSLVVIGGGSFRRIRLALGTEWRTLRDRKFAEKVETLLAPAKAKPPEAAKPSAAPVRLLALLQREGRLLDFLMEDIQSYRDQDIGAAVRDIHRDCHTALKQHLVLQPVLAQEEGKSVEIAEGFDPSAVRLTGNVTGQPPFRGTLKHRGWRVQEIKLPPAPQGQDEWVLMPAEVELP